MILINHIWFNIKNKYEGTVLGYFWHIIPILLQFLTLNFILSKMMNFSSPSMSSKLLIGLICWSFFRDMTSSASHLVTFKWYHIKNYYFDLNNIMVIEFLTAFFNAFISILLALIFVSFNDISFNKLQFTISIINLTLLTYLISSILFIIGAVYRDTFHLWNSFCGLLFWSIPIVYPIEKIPSNYINLFELNPIFISIKGLTQSLEGSGSSLLILIQTSIVYLILSVVLSLFNNNFRNQVVAQL